MPRNPDGRNDGTGPRLPGGRADGSTIYDLTDGFGVSGPPNTGANDPPGSGPSNQVAYRSQILPAVELRLTGTAKGTTLRHLTGHCRVAAQIYAWHGDEDNQTFVMLFGAGRVARWGSAWLNSETLDASAAGVIYFAKYDGTQSVVDSYAASNFADFASYLPGLPYSVFIQQTDKLREYGLPNLEQEMHLAAYDPWAATWAESENPVLGLYTYLTQDLYGPRLDPSLIDLPSWLEARQWCDEDVNGSARWRAGGVVSASSVLGVARAYLEVAWAELSWQSGRWYLVPRNPASQGATIPAVQPVKVERRRIAYSAKPSGVEVSFRNASNDWNDDTAPALAANVTRRSIDTYAPPLLNAADTAARHAQMKLETAHKATARYTATVDPAESPAIITARPGDLIDLDYNRAGDTVRGRVERIRPEGVLYRLALLGDNDHSVTVLPAGDDATGWVPPTGAPPSRDYHRQSDTGYNPVTNTSEGLDVFTWADADQLDAFDVELQHQLELGGPWVPWVRVPASRGELRERFGGYSGPPDVDAVGPSPDYGRRLVCFWRGGVKRGTVWAQGSSGANSSVPPTVADGEVLSFNASSGEPEYRAPSIKNPLPEGETLQAAGPGPGPHDLIGLSTTGVEVGDGDVPLELTGSGDAPTYNGDALAFADDIPTIPTIPGGDNPLILKYQVPVYGKDSGGTARPLIYMASPDFVAVGNGGVNTTILSNSARIGATTSLGFDWLARMGDLILTGSGPGDPTTANCPAGRWIAWLDTSANKASLWVNDGGVMRNV
jgi:hypothetical protein